MASTILRGKIMAGLVDISVECSQCTINLKRASVAVPGTFGQDPYTDMGDLAKEAVLSYRSRLAGAVGTPASTIFWDAILAGETVDITAVMNPGVVSATNPQYEFTVVPLETSRGGEVGSAPIVTATYSIVGDIVINPAGA